MQNKKIILFIMFLSIFIYIPKANAMEIFVKKPSAENIIVEVESSDTIEVLKQKIYIIDNTFMPENQRLIFSGKEMENGRTLADYGVQKESTIHLIPVVNKLGFKVLFDANEGYFKKGNTLTIEKWEVGMENTLEIPSREGYTFLGYYTEKVGGTKLELILAESGIDSDMTFYAQWEENSSAVPPISEDIENPKTGDNIIISIVLLVFSLVVIASLIVFNNKKNTNN